MTDKIMTLADAYAAADAEEHHEMEFGNQDRFEAAIYKNQQARAALAAAIKAEQDYTAAVIDERDALRAQVTTYVRIGESMNADFDKMRSERDESAKLLQQALDERDHYIEERDKLTMAHAERTVERDKLRDQIHTCSPACSKSGCVNGRLRKVAQAVVDRWESPQWDWEKDGPTAGLVNALRRELAI